MTGKDTLQFSKAEIETFCQKWKVAELHMFGSILREDFGPESDVDVLVNFLPDAPWTLLDLVRMEGELSQLFGRKVDLVERPTVERSENHIRRERILSSLEPLYVAG